MDDPEARSGLIDYLKAGSRDPRARHRLRSPVRVLTLIRERRKIKEPYRINDMRYGEINARERL